MENPTLGERIKRLREEAGFTPYRLGRLSKIDPGYIARIETGAIKKPGLPVLKKLASGLEISLFKMIGEEESAPARAPAAGADSDRFVELKRALSRFGVKELDFMGKVMQIPQRGYVPARAPYVIQHEEGEGLIISRNLVESLTDRPGDLYSLRIDGESLANDGIHSENVIVVLPTQEIDVEGKLYIIKDPECGEAVLRHLSHKGGRIRIYASHPNFQALLVEEVKVLGRVIYIQPPGREA